ncbi:MAG: DUF4056 domain-containing protein [Planctomycetota bacterium]|jgi:hypothetical protein
MVTKKISPSDRRNLSRLEKIDYNNSTTMKWRKIKIKRSIFSTSGRDSKFVKILFTILLSVLLSAFNGCTPSNEKKLVTFRLDQFKKTPKIRIGSLASPFIGTKYLGYDQLGKHGYNSGLHEKNGIIYTCRAGHIDIAHVRNNADWTAHLAAVAYHHIRQKHTYFNFKAGEDSIYHVELEYPKNWDKYPALVKYKAMKEVSIGLGSYLTYIASVWHEVITWFGYKSFGVYSEFHSAFSWEDTFSNVLGISLGEQAVRDNFNPYDEFITMLLQRNLKMLDPQSPEVAEEAIKQLEGQWFSNRLLYMETQKRNYDIGFTDRFITPMTIPFGCEPENLTQVKIEVPNTDFLSEYDFTMKLEIEPREWEKNKILQVVYPNPDSKADRIDPRRDFIHILKYIEKTDAKKYDQEAKKP